VNDDPQIPLACGVNAAYSQVGLFVSVVIPCLNEANSLAICIDKAVEAFRHIPINGEVVVADNGSTDGSIDIAQQHGARVVHVSAKGYGNALRAGIEAAHGAFIIMGDADDSYDFSEVPKFVAKWREGYDFVMGNRFAGGIQPGAMPPSHKIFGNPALTAILNLFFRAQIGDAYCGMRGFTKQIYKAIEPRTTGMEFALELVIKAAQMRTRLTEVPIKLWPDKRGRPPHLRTLHDGWRSLRFMLLLAPNWLFVLPGGLLAVIGLSLVFWLLPGPRNLRHSVIDVHTMLFGMVFALTGTQIIAIGLFAKVYSFAERLAPKQQSLEHWLRRIKLEEGLAFGAVITLFGAGGIAWVVYQWVRSDFGPLFELRTLIFFSLWFLLGIQVVFSSFFLSMLGISRGTYIGDYERR
jgi:glycosyltransferase involved in cell wall biosynthesis